jgi:hypothetical protein
VKRWKRRIRRAALSLFAAAAVAPAALALPPEDVAFGPASTQVVQVQSKRPDDRAGIRAVDGIVLGDAQGALWGIAPEEILANEPGVPAVDQSASSLYTPESVKAMGDRYQGQAEVLGVAGHVPAAGSAVESGGGVDWKDAGMGALGAFGAMFLAALTVVAMRKQNKVAAP